MRAHAAVILLALALGIPAGAAQSHDHGSASGPSLLLLHDGPADGRAVVGSLAFFGFALVAPDGSPIEHHDFRVTVTQNGRVLLDTPDAHDYDGVYSAAFTFTEPGPYEVRAEAVRGGSVVAEAAFAGVAVEPEAQRDVLVVLEKPEGAVPGQPSEFGVRVESAVGADIIPHSDALVEIRRLDDSLLVLRAHLHTHADPMRFQYAFPTPGEYAVTVSAWNAFPTEGSDVWSTATIVEFVDVDPRVDVGDAAALLPHAASRTASQPDASASATDYSLHVTTDPTPFADQRVAGPLTQMRLSGLVQDDAMRAAVQHVNFRASLAGPFGTVFASDSLHEYDGHYELVVNGLAPGDYAFALDAETGEWSESGGIAFRVVPPVVPLSPGPYVVTMDAPSDVVAGEAVDLVFAAKNALGVAFDHTELDVTILPPASMAPLANLKLHTHDSGEYRLSAAFPTAGTWRVVADPSPLEPRPALAVGPGGPGALIVFEVDVLPAPEQIVDGALDAAEDAGATVEVPGPAGLVAVAALVGLAVVAGRRRYP